MHKNDEPSFKLTVHKNTTQWSSTLLRKETTRNIVFELLTLNSQPSKTKEIYI